MKMTLKSPLRIYAEVVPKFAYIVHQGTVFQVVGDPCLDNEIPVLDVQKDHMTTILGSNLVTPVDVEITFTPKLGDEVLS